MKDETGV